MSSSRFNRPDPTSNGQPDPLLMVKVEHDPSELIMLDPAPSRILFCLSQVAASLHPEAVEMIERSLKTGMPLDVETLSRASESARAIVEERTTLRVEQGEPQHTRAVVVSRLRPPEGPMSEHNDEDHRDLSLHLTQSIAGKIEAILTWESEDLSTDLNMLRERWERFDKLYEEMGLPPLPFDLGPLAHDPSGEDPDPLFDHEGTTVAAYITPPDVILNYRAPANSHDDEDEVSEFAREDGETEFTGDDDGFDAQSSDADVLDYPGVSRERETSEHRDPTPEPGDQLTIINPTAAQLAKIARLSGTPARREVLERIMEATRLGEEIDTRTLSSLSTNDYKELVISAKRRFELAGGLQRTRSVTIGDARDRDGIGFSITLSNVDQTGAAKNSPLKALLTWELFDIDAHVRNWESILKIAGGTGPRR